MTALREHQPDLLVETLVGDFGGRKLDIQAMVEAGPDVFAHNIEVCRRLTPKIRDQRCGYDRSLSVLRYAKELAPTRLTKSSIIGNRAGETIGSPSVGSSGAGVAVAALAPGRAQAQGPRRADQPRQQPTAGTGIRDQPPMCEIPGKARIGRGDTDVALRRELRAHTHRRTIHGGNHRLRTLHQRPPAFPLFRTAAQPALRPLVALMKRIRVGLYTDDPEPFMGPLVNAHATDSPP